MTANTKQWTIYDRVVAILTGQKPDRIPFVDRLSIWYQARTLTGAMPAEYEGMSLNQVHRAVGIGHMTMLYPYSLRLRGVEIVSSFEGEVIYRETDPVVDYFPSLRGMGVADRPGITTIELITPVGRLRLQHQILESMIRTGVVPYLREHLIKEEADYRTAEYIIERAEFVPQYDRLYQAQAEMEGSGYVNPNIHRIPFQQVMLEFLGEQPLFYALYDNPRLVRRLVDLLDEQVTDILHQLADFEGVYIQFGDNLDGMMTNPNLFKEYCLPYYQRYADILHGQGRKMGSHADGNLKPLLGLLAESGLDVCESVAPYPLTPASFDEIWTAWRQGPLIWGGIPTPILEEGTSEADFQAYIQDLLETVGDQPIILGVSDMVLGHNLIERVKYVAEQVEAWPYGES